ncbi:MAG: hypothetical protein JWL62_2408 [Hyphomicrobiales bacterium]|nr:hypothetical protein [Hyphomicrobiales bacterium]
MSERKHIIDFWRGLALVMIFINHVPDNYLENLTSRNFGFSDGAEAFVFLAGLSLALVYLPHRGGQPVIVSPLALLARCWKRAFTLYRTHLMLTFSVLGAFALAYAVLAIPEFRDAHGRALIYDDPARAFTGILLLLHQLDYVDILPLYVVLLLFAPVQLILMQRNVALGLCVSVAIYAAARLLPIDMPTWPMDNLWFFNPFAWQLMLGLGMAAGILYRNGGVPHSRVALASALTMLIISAVMATETFGQSPGLMIGAREILDSGKHELGLMRISHFLALAYVLSVLPLGASWVVTKTGQELCRLGRHSLAVFVVGTFVAQMCQLTMVASAVNFDVDPQPVGLVTTLIGLVVLFSQARYLEWKKSNPEYRIGRLVRSHLPFAGWQLFSSLSRPQSRL